MDGISDPQGKLQRISSLGSRGMGQNVDRSKRQEFSLGRHAITTFHVGIDIIATRLPHVLFIVMHSILKPFTFFELIKKI
jgi:hypothetical protein